MSLRATASAKPKRGIAFVLGFWLVGVFAASLFGRMYLRGYPVVLLLAASVLWPLLFFAFSKYRFLPGRITLDRGIALFAFGLFGTASIFASPIMLESLAYFGLTLVALLLALQFNSNLQPAQYELGIKIYAVLCTFLLVGFAFYDYAPGIRLGNNKEVLSPNAVALVAVSAIVAAVAIRIKVFRYSAIAAGAAVIILTGSRTSTAAVLIALSVAFLIRMKTAKASSKVAIALLLVVSAVAAYVYSELFLTDVEQFLALNDQHRGISSGATGRMVAWRYTWEMFLSNPIIGVGFRAHEHVLQVATSAHNGYLSTLAEMGVVGSTAMFYLIIRGQFALLQKVRGTEFVYTHAALYGLTFAYMFLAIFERYLINVGNPTSLMFLLAIFAFGQQSAPHAPSIDDRSVKMLSNSASTIRQKIPR